jgi:hypothetical protein
MTLDVFQKNNVLDLFFKEGESFCISPNKYGYNSVTKEDINKGVYLQPHKGTNAKPVFCSLDNATMLSLNPVKGERRDENVTALRSFLVEVDFGSLKEQYDYINSLKMPYSVAIFSGNKSIHFGIVLDDDLPDLDSYKVIAEWILRIADKADQMTKNPTRCIRFPNVIRKETGRLQKLLEVKGKVSYADLSTWLKKHPDKDPRIEYNLKKRTSEVYYEDVTEIPAWVLEKLKFGVNEGNGRNNEWFIIFTHFAKAGLTEDEMVYKLEEYFSPERDFTLREWKTIAKSACRTINRG